MWLFECWDCGFESCWLNLPEGMGIHPLCCVGSGLCKKLISCSEEFYHMCVCVCVCV